jgi:PAS domain S-box-containing protein
MWMKHSIMSTTNNKLIQKLTNNLDQLNINLKSFLGTEGVFILILGILFVGLTLVLSIFVSDVHIPLYWIMAWFVITSITVFSFYKYEFMREENAQLVLFFFGVGIMGTTVFLKYLNDFSDDFVFFYWTMAVSVSLGISNLRFMIQIWAIPLFFVLFATFFADIPETEKVQFYIWNPIITVMSFFGIYSSMRTRNDSNIHKEQAKKYKFEFENLMDTMSNTVIIKDDKNNVLKANKQHAKLNNKLISDFENKSLYDLLPTELATKYHHEDLEIISSRKAKLGNLEEIHLSVGDSVWLRTDKFPYYNEEGKVRGVVIFGTDVTMEVNAKLETLRSEARYKQVFAEAPYGIITFNKDRKITAANKTFQKMLGFEQQELIGKHINDLAADPYLSDDENIKHEPQRECFLLRKDKSVFVAQLMFSKVKDNGGMSSYYIAIVEDITEKKEAEKQLETYSKALQESNKDLEQFAYIASHDMKEPLRMVNSYVTLLGKMYGHKLDKRGLEFIQFASDGVKRMDNLIRDLLEYSRIGKGKIKSELISFDDTLLKVTSNLRVQINEKRVDFDVNVDLPMFLANRTQIFMLFQNIISNGIKYNQDTPLISISADIEGDFIKFIIQDNGIGMERKHLDTIFQIFQRLHGIEEYEGTGIGLAVCKRIVKQHNGEIWVESEVGVGSTFHFTLPFITKLKTISA